MDENRRKIHVLGIESSCDDTGVAIVDHQGTILSNCIHSQLKQHLANGGIIPVVAKEYHLDHIDRIANQAFVESGLASVAKDVDGIAVSTRPGMAFSLQVGLNYARKLAKKYSKPLIPIHHMHAHALMPLLQNKSIRFPFLALLISGGHCILSIAKRYNEFHILGSTKDDAPGDLLDKVARRLKLRNLGEPFDRISGGAAIELLAGMDGANRFKYFASDSAIPMIRYASCDFSFSGYRGNFDLLTPKIDQLWLSGDGDALRKELSDICASLQRAMLIQLVKKLQRALVFYKTNWRYRNEDAFAPPGSGMSHLGFELLELQHYDRGIDVVISGGVAANSYLVEGIRLACDQVFEDGNRVFSPSKALCSDNGLMIAWNGMLRYRDFLSNKHGHQLSADVDSIIFDPGRMDGLKVQPECRMGLDVTGEVKANRFKLLKLSHPEFRLVQAPAVG